MEIGIVYSFNSKSPLHLGQKFTGLKLISITTAELAEKFAPVTELYRKIYPTLPNGTPVSPKDGVWYIFETTLNASDKQKIVLSHYFIDHDSIEVVSLVSAKVIFPSVSSSDLVKVRNAITAAGFSDFEITVD